MIAEIIPKGGLGTGQPLVIDVAQIILRYPNGTPFAIAALYGQDRSVACSMAGMKDFNTLLHRLGVDMTVIVDTIEMPPPPPGARLIHGPNS